MQLMGKIGGLLLASYAHVAVASEATHGVNWWHLGAAYKDAPALGWLSITFIIFVYGISRAIKKPLSLYLETRSKDIRRQIEEGRQAKIESEKKLKLYDEKLSSLHEEIEKIKQAFSDQAQAEKLLRRRLAEEMEARVLKDADDTIKANIERSKNRLAEEVIAHAVTLAEQTIAEKSGQLDGLFKANFVSDLEASATKTKRDYVVSEVARGSRKPDAFDLAREVH